MSVAHQLRDLREDVRSLLKYSQTLRNENDRLRCALRGALLFLKDNDNAKVCEEFAVSSAEPPVLKTVWSAPLSPDDTHCSKTFATLSSKLPPDADSFSSSELNLGYLPNGRASRTNPSTKGGIMEDNDRGPPQIFNVEDLANVLLEYNKLLGRLKQFIASPATSTIPASSFPNIGEQGLTDIGVVGFRENQNTSDFVVHVSWSSGESFEIYRKYTDFFTLQARLREIEEQTVKPLPQLPLSDHLLAVIGQLDSIGTLHPRLELVDNFCMALNETVKEKEEGDLFRTSILIFFVPWQGDILIEKTRLKTGRNTNATERESEVFDSECLGFVSSVALEQDQQWYSSNLDDEDVPKKTDSPSSDKTTNPKLTQSPSQSPSPLSGTGKPHLLHTESAPAVFGVLQDNSSYSSPLLDEIAAKLSRLQSFTSLDHDNMMRPPRRGRGEGRRSDGGGEEAIYYEVDQTVNNFRHRSSRVLKDSDLSLARHKAACIKTGSMDWGVRHGPTGSTGAISQASGVSE